MGTPTIDRRADHIGSHGTSVSIVHLPNRLAFLGIGCLFLGVGIWFFATAEIHVPPGWPVVVLGVCAGLFAALGAVPVFAGLRAMLLPQSVRHTPSDRMLSVPTEPVILQGQIVCARLVHELVRNGADWELRPNPKQWRNDKRQFVGFGAFCLTFSVIFSWLLHRELGFGWLGAILLTAVVVNAFVGAMFVLIAQITQAGYKRLTTLSYSAARDELLLDSRREPSAGNDVVHAAMHWFHSEDGDRQQAIIPRKHVAAVQLCPWKYVLGSSHDQSTTWAVQGVLVLTPSEDGTHQRLPLLLTSDFVRAARLMQRLSEMLDVPYHFHADAAGWTAELKRAKDRAPLKAGGTQS